MQLTGAGTGLAPVQLARKPKVVVPFGARFPFQLALRTVTVDPVWVCVPPQTCAIVCPFGNAQLTDHPVDAVVLLLNTVTSPWNPPCHDPVTR